METGTGRFNLATVSISVLVSVVALLLSVIAFFSLYANNQSLWAAVCLFGLIPALLLCGVVFTVRDIVTRRCWRQAIGVLLMVITSAALISGATSIRFYLHQLFTFRPLDLHIPPLRPNPVVFMHEFKMCGKEQHCESPRTVEETTRFTLNKIPDGCCSLLVVNRCGEGVDSFQIVLNGKKVKLSELPGSNGDAMVAAVELAVQNEIRVQLRGDPAAHMYVLVSNNRTNLR